VPDSLRGSRRGRRLRCRRGSRAKTSAMPRSSMSPRCHALSSVAIAARGSWHRHACARASTRSAHRLVRAAQVLRQWRFTPGGLGGSRLAPTSTWRCSRSLRSTNTPIALRS